MSLTVNNATTLADLTRPGLIVPSLRRQGTADVIRELSEALEREGRVPGARQFHDAVLKREALASTEMEAGMAFPHARSPGIKELSFALGRSMTPFRWDARIETAAPGAQTFLSAATSDNGKVGEISATPAYSDVAADRNVRAPGVWLVFLIAVPESGSAEYLQLISGLARFSKDRQLVDQLLAAENAAQLFSVLRSVRLRPNPCSGPANTAAVAGSILSK